MIAEKTCNTCGKPARSPWRVRDGMGQVLLGCVDAVHEVVSAPVDADWHNRPEAKKARVGLKRMLSAK